MLNSTACNWPILSDENAKMHLLLSPTFNIYFFNLTSFHFMDVSLEAITPSLMAVQQGKDNPEGTLQPTPPRASEELPNELPVFLTSLEIKGEC